MLCPHAKRGRIALTQRIRAAIQLGFGFAYKFWKTQQQMGSKRDPRLTHNRRLPPGEKSFKASICTAFWAWLCSPAVVACSSWTTAFGISTVALGQRAHALISMYHAGVSRSPCQAIRPVEATGERGLALLAAAAGQSAGSDANPLSAHLGGEHAGLCTQASPSKGSHPGSALRPMTKRSRPEGGEHENGAQLKRSGCGAGGVQQASPGRQVPASAPAASGRQRAPGPAGTPGIELGAHCNPLPNPGAGAAVSSGERSIELIDHNASSVEHTAGGAAARSPAEPPGRDAQASPCSAQNPAASFHPDRHGQPFSCDPATNTKRMHRCVLFAR